MMSRAPQDKRDFAGILALCSLIAGLAAGAAAAVPAAEPADSGALHAWEGGNDPASLERWVRAHLRRADAAIARVVAVKGAHRVANTLLAQFDSAPTISSAAR